MKMDKNLIKTVTISLIISSIVFGYYMITNNGLFTLIGDFNTQSITFMDQINAMIKNGGEWCWNLDLGTQLIGGFSYYGLGSPFFWPTLLLDRHVYPYLVGCGYIVKYCFTSVASYIYIKRFVKNSKYAVIGALLYSFSGFQCTSLWFYNFHDMVALFPLMLIGMEELLENNKHTFFIFSIFINCICNYFFFIGEVVFLIIYFLVRIDYTDKRVVLNKIITSIFCGILGVGMAATLFIPSILFITQNKRTEQSIYFSDIILDKNQFLFYIKNIFLPAESMIIQSSIFNGDGLTISAYMPMINNTLVISYIIGNKEKKDWIKKLLIFSVIAAFMPIISSGFYLFTSNYCRWWYMWILIMSLASSIVLDNKEKFDVNIGIIANLTIVILVFIGIGYMKYSWNTDTIVFDRKLFNFTFILGLVGVIWTYISLDFSNKYMYKSLLLGVSVFSIVTTFNTVKLYKRHAPSSSEYIEEYMCGTQLKSYDDQYRYNMTDNVKSLVGGAVSTWSFTSTASSSIDKFSKLYGYERIVYSLDMNTISGLNELMGAKYRIYDADKLNIDNISNLNIMDEISYNNRKWYVIAFDACPIGFRYNKYLTISEVMNADIGERGLISLDNLIISKKDEDRISKIISKGDINSKDREDLIQRNIDNKVDNFERNSKGFSCTTNYTEDSIIYFSVPNDNGWKAMINGVETDIIDSNGMMCIVVPSGENKIEFVYKTPGLRLGLAVTTISWIIYIGIALVKRVKVLKIKLNYNSVI